MAHDFMIRVKDGIWQKRTKTVLVKTEPDYDCFKIIEDPKYKGVPEDEVYFFGYAGGIFYEAFECQKHDMMFSGDGEIIVLDYSTAFKGLEKVMRMFNEKNYPDPERINDIKDFYERMKTDYINIKYFEICFD